MISGYSQVKQLKLIDVYTFDWKMDGRKGSVPMVTLYDYKEHKSYSLRYDENCNLSDCNFLTDYLFKIECKESYGKIKETVTGVKSIQETVKK